MATYPVYNRVTGEQKEVVLSVHDWERWKTDNPDWERDWSDPSTVPGSGEVGEWRDKMAKTHPGWSDIMRNKIKPKAVATTTKPSQISTDMPVRKKTVKSPGQGMSSKQKKRRKPISEEFMVQVEPLTHNQKIFFDEWDKGNMLYAYGVAGTGKTFIALYKALKDVLNEYTPYEKIYIVRSLVATREIGFLPGDHEDKSSLYQIPYKNMVQSMFEMPDDNSYEMLYSSLKQQETISFWSTSFIRGTTLDNSIIIIDECQNLNFHELDSIITRVGQDTRIVFCGDASQTDLIRVNERSGILDFQRILQNMPEFSLVEFGIDDIVRSGLVKSYLINKINLGL